MEPVILYEDNHIIVAVKPQNVPTQADSSGDADFLNIIKEYVKVKYNKPGNAFIGLVHRLDRPRAALWCLPATVSPPKGFAVKSSRAISKRNILP